MVEDRDRDGAGLAGDASADHQDDAELSERVGERQDDAGHDARAGEREDDPEERPGPGGAEGGRGLEKRSVDGGEGSGKRLDGEREAVEDRRDEETLEREREAGAEERLDGAADGAARSEEEEDVEPQDRGREDDRERDDRLDERLPAGPRRREPPGQRQAEGDEERRRGQGEAEAEEKGRNVDAQRSPPAGLISAATIFPSGRGSHSRRSVTAQASGRWKSGTSGASSFASRIASSRSERREVRTNAP